MNEKELLNSLSALKRVQPREEWIKKNREILSYQIFNGQESAGNELGWFAQIGLVIQRLAQPAPIAALIALFFVVSGFVGVRASSDSKPGDPLYIAKTISEKVASGITFDEKEKAKLNVEFAQRRVAELEQIAQEDKQAAADDVRVKELSDNFKAQIASARERLNKLQTEEVKPSAAIQATVKPKLNLGKTDPKEPEEEAEPAKESEVMSADSGKEEKGIEISIPSSELLEQAEKLFNEKDYTGAAGKLGEINIK